MANPNLPPKDDLTQKVERILGEPMVENYSENTLRIRRNLMIVSTIALFYKLNDLHITGGSFLGLNFSNLTNNVITTALFIIVLYNLIHFVISSWEHFYYLRIRMTATRVSHVTVGKSASEYGDYPNNPKQSSLYNWWIENNRRVVDVKYLKNQTEEFQQTLSDFVTHHQQNDKNQIHNEIVPLKNSLSSFSRNLDDLIEILSSERIAVSLNRFDGWFLNYQKLQLFRWLVIEWALPIVLGACAAIIMYPLVP